MHVTIVADHKPEPTQTVMHVRRENCSVRLELAEKLAGGEVASPLTDSRMFASKCHLRSRDALSPNSVTGREEYSQAPREWKHCVFENG